MATYMHEKKKLVEMKKRSTAGTRSLKGAENQSGITSASQPRPLWSVTLFLLFGVSSYFVQRNYELSCRTLVCGIQLPFLPSHLCSRTLLLATRNKY
jgi:hypothetical protein